MPAAAKRAAEESRRQFERQMSGIRQVSANTFGDVVNDIGDVVEVLGTLPPPALIAAGSIAAIAAGAVGVAALSTAMFTLVDGAHEAREALAGLEQQGVLTLDVTDEQTAAMGEYEAATDLAAAQLSALRVEIAAQVIPAWRDAAVDVVAAGLALRDTADAMSGVKAAIDDAVVGATGIRRVANAVATLGASEVYRGVHDGMEGLADSVALAADEQGGYLERAALMVRSLEEQRRAADETAAAVGRVSGGPSRRAGGMGDEAREMERVAAARQAVADAMRRQEFADEVAAGVERARMAEQGAAMQAALDAEEQAAHEDRMRRAQEVVEAERQIRLARIESTQAIVSGAADAIAAIDETSRAAKLAGLAEALVNFGASITAAFAQGGPIAGPALAASVIGQLAPVISSMRALVGGGPAAPRTGGGSGGGGGGGPFGRSEYGFTGRDASGNTVVVAEYRGELYDAQSYDAIRRPGSPLRDLSRRQRVTR
jgi:hypothetical protein